MELSERCFGLSQAWMIVFFAAVARSPEHYWSWTSMIGVCMSVIVVLLFHSCEKTFDILLGFIVGTVAFGGVVMLLTSGSTPLAWCFIIMGALLMLQLIFGARDIDIAAYCRAR